MVQPGAVQMDCEMDLNINRTGCLTGCRVQGERHSGPFLGSWLRCQGVSGTYHIRGSAGITGLNSSLFCQLDNVPQAPSSRQVLAFQV